MKTALLPIVDGNSRVLVLGTLPGEESLRQQRYYSHGRNRFWSIMSRVYGATIGDDPEERFSFLRRHGIALWDVLASADRVGSLDSAIKNPVPNDLAGFFADYPNISRVGLNGGTAAKLFDRFGRQSVPPAVAIDCLPSTSPVPGRNVLSLDEKVERWRSFLENAGRHEPAR